MKNIVSKSELLIFFIIIIQPVIDVLTSLSTMYNSQLLSIGALFRTGLLIVLAIYIFFYLLYKEGQIIYLYLLSFLTISIMFLINTRLKTPFIFMSEMNFTLKTAYFIVMLFAVVVLLDKQIVRKRTLLQATNAAAVLIGISFWLAILTNTSMTSYRYGESGFSGWFYATNEFSVTVIILLGLTIAHLHVEKSVKTWVALVLLMSILPMIGTKVAFLGGMIILFAYGVLLLFQYPKKLFRKASNTFYYALVIVFFLTIPFTPAAVNTKNANYMMINEAELNMIAKDRVTMSTHPFLSKVLSSRDVYFQEKRNNFSEAIGSRKAFGLGFAGDYRTVPKIIEMDFFDLFFSYGYIGSFVLLLPLIYVLWRMLRPPIDAQRSLLLLTVGLCFGFSFLAGHVLFAPSVMSYVAILFLVIGLPNEEKGWRLE